MMKWWIATFCHVLVNITCSLLYCFTLYCRSHHVPVYLHWLLHALFFFLFVILLGLLGIGQVQHHPQPFPKKSLDFYTIRSGVMGNNCMLSFTLYIDLLLKKYENFSIFYFSKLTSINKQYSSLWGHPEDDAVHTIPHKMETHWQNKLKILILV